MYVRWMTSLRNGWRHEMFVRSSVTCEMTDRVGHQWLSYQSVWQRNLIWLLARGRLSVTVGNRDPGWGFSSHWRMSRWRGLGAAAPEVWATQILAEAEIWAETYLKKKLKTFRKWKKIKCDMIQMEVCADLQPHWIAGVEEDEFLQNGMSSIFVWSLN